MADANVPVLCNACGKVSAPWRGKFPWIGVVGLGWVSAGLGGFALAMHYLDQGDALCGNCGRKGPFARAPADAQVQPTRRVRRVAGILGTLLFIGFAATLAIMTLVEGLAVEEATGTTDETYVYTFAAYWIGLPFLGVVVAAIGRARRARILRGLQAGIAAPAQPAPPPVPTHPAPMPAAPTTPVAPPAAPTTAYELLPRIELLEQRHPNLAELPRLRELAAQANAAELALRLGEIEAKLAERARLLRSSQETARKIGKLSERLADGELSESAYQSAKAHLEREAAAMDERIRALDGELFREEFEKPI